MWQRRRYCVGGWGGGGGQCQGKKNKKEQKKYGRTWVILKLEPTSVFVRKCKKVNQRANAKTWGFPCMTCFVFSPASTELQLTITSVRWAYWRRFIQWHVSDISCLLAWLLYYTLNIFWHKDQFAFWDNHNVITRFIPVTPPPPTDWKQASKVSFNLYSSLCCASIQLTYIVFRGGLLSERSSSSSNPIHSYNAPITPA